MFDIGWSELLVIGIVALVVIGPKELPGVFRTVSQMMGKVRRMASEFQGQFQEAMREADMADLKKQVDALGETARGVTDFNPVEAARREMETVFDEKPKVDAAADPALAPEAGLAGADPAGASTFDSGKATEPVIAAPEPVVPITDADFREPRATEPAPAPVSRSG
jgi:sec-independent protein translocase protein TatB